MPSAEIEDPYLLDSECGAFVTLHKGSRLRGCIGTCFPDRSLYETVVEMTQAAASRDYRFSPIGQDELADIRIDISVLSRPESVSEPLSLRVGEHGLLVSHGRRRGVLLPQVATENGWDMRTFLGQVCLKADLAEDAWERPETRISSFTVQVIEEER